jgi:hypothetical protein
MGFPSRRCHPHLDAALAPAPTARADDHPSGDSHRPADNRSAGAIVDFDTLDCSAHDCSSGPTHHLCAHDDALDPHDSSWGHHTDSVADDHRPGHDHDLRRQQWWWQREWSLRSVKPAIPGETPWS